ncbi:hypothetical protein Tco_0423336, partial [Tanacetum coccineum]
PEYVTESDPKEYGDDETEYGPVDYPIDGGDGRDDDDGNSSRDDANDEDEDEDEEDEEDEEEEEHLALAKSVVVVPADEPVSPPEGTEPIIPPFLCIQTIPKKSLNNNKIIMTYEQGIKNKSGGCVK